MVPAGSNAKRLSSVNHTTKTIHHHFFFQKMCNIVHGLEIGPNFTILFSVTVNCFPPAPSKHYGDCKYWFFEKFIMVLTGLKSTWNSSIFHLMICMLTIFVIYRLCAFFCFFVWGKVKKLKTKHFKFLEKISFFGNEPKWPSIGSFARIQFFSVTDQLFSWSFSWIYWKVYECKSSVQNSS